jgi:beta-galactosidase GanA
MEKEFVPYELALRMKQLGFNEPCFGYYFNHSEENFKEGKFDYRGELNIEYSIYKENTYYILAPTFSQAFRFFREKHGLCHFINFSGDGFCSGWEDKGFNEHGFENFKTYEEAELACLEKLIEIVEQK